MMFVAALKDCRGCDVSASDWDLTLCDFPIHGKPKPAYSQGGLIHSAGRTLRRSIRAMEFSSKPVKRGLSNVVSVVQ